MAQHRPWAGSSDLSGALGIPLWSLEVANPPDLPKRLLGERIFYSAVCSASDVAPATSWPSFFLWTLPSPMSPLPQTPAPLGFSCGEGLCEGCCCQVCRLSTRLVCLSGEGKKAPTAGELTAGGPRGGWVLALKRVMSDCTQAFMFSWW